MQQPIEAPEELPVTEAGGGRGEEAGEEPQKLIIHLNPINLDPSATSQPKNSPLPVYILPVAQPIHEEPAPAAKAKANLALPAMQNFKKLVAIVHNFSTTSKIMAAAHITWHSGWFGCWFGFGAPEPRHF